MTNTGNYELHPAFKALEANPLNEISPELTTNLANMMRNKLKEVEKIGRDVADWIKQVGPSTGDKGECIANAILALRHIEDARMRYGKVIQYVGDGVSIYDK